MWKMTIIGKLLFTMMNDVLRIVFMSRRTKFTFFKPDRLMSQKWTWWHRALDDASEQFICNIFIIVKALLRQSTACEKVLSMTAKFRQSNWWTLSDRRWDKVEKKFHLGEHRRNIMKDSDETPVGAREARFYRTHCTILTPPRIWRRRTDSHWTLWWSERHHSNNLYFFPLD